MSRGFAVVIGLGRSGAACARALAAEGYAVRVVDRSDSEALRATARGLGDGIEVRLGGYPLEVAAGADLLCPSPGVPWNAPELQEARRRGIPVRSELDLVFERCRASIIGITGTNGKTTTCSLTRDMLARTGAPAHLGGNIGATVIDRLDRIAPGDWLVLELSSFQIESISAPRCRIAAVLNVSADHLDRHGSLEAYAGLKRRLVEHAGSAAVLGYDDHITREMAAHASAPVSFFGLSTSGVDGATVVDGQVVAYDDGVPSQVMPVADIPLFGGHNVANVLAAVCVGRAAGMGTEPMAEAVRAFRPPDHRLQTVCEHEGVLWVNDSKATNDDAARRALEAFPGRRIIWIGGGRSKGVSPAGLARDVARCAAHALLIGETASELDSELAALGFTRRSVPGELGAAVSEARRLARSGDVVLLAPGYASFDQFDDFEDRGRRFAALAAEVCR